MRRISRIDGFTGTLRSVRSIVLLSTLVAVAIGATASLVIWHTYQTARDEKLRQMDSMGIVLAEQTRRYVQVIDMTLQGVQSRIASLNITTPEEFQAQLATPSIHTYLADRLKAVPQIGVIHLIDNQARIVNWSLNRPVEIRNVTDREYFQYLRDHDDPGVFVGGVAKSRSMETLSLFFARRITSRDGRFLGLVLAVVDIRYLSEFYQAAGEHVSQSVTLLRPDGTILLRYPDPEGAIGAKLAPTSPWFAAVAKGGGSYAAVAAASGIPSLISAHPLSEYPLVVDILMREEDIYAASRREAVYIAAAALIAELGFASLFRMLARQFRQQTEQNSKLEEAAARLQAGQDILRAYTAMSSDWLWEQDADLRYVHQPGFPPTGAEDDVGRTRWEVADPAMPPERWAIHHADLAARRPFRDFRWERMGLDGMRRCFSSNGDPVYDQNGMFTGYRGTGRDITAEVQASARLAQAYAELEQERERFAAVLNNIIQGVCFFDGAQRLLLWNRRFSEIYELPPEATRVGCTLADIMAYRVAVGTAPEMPEAEYIAGMVRVADGRRPSSSILPLRNGRYVATCYQPMPGGGFVATHEDITERQKAEASVAFMAHHDALTKLPNRVLFREHMEQAIAMAGCGHEFALICLDLDNFKHVNDTLGHPVGDGLLVAVSDRLVSCVGAGDTVARLGGDEFAVIQLGIGQPADAAALVDRIIESFRDPFDVDGRKIMTGTSIGVVVAVDDNVSYEALMRDADIALYLAKAEGRGTARFFQPEMDVRIHLRRAMEVDLQGAVFRNEFELYYQPQVSLTTDSVCGFEALLRWNHPERGLVSPLEFIPVAEETGQILEIGEWVLWAACFEAERWPDHISVAVNLSPLQFKKGDLVANVRDALDASGLRPERLELEITESVFLRDSAETLAALRQLRAIGVSVALDDFGTGYSSLSYLRSFPFNKLKIDQSFVRGMLTNRESLSIIRAVTGLGQSLGMITIAEGVETAEQLTLLRDEGCSEAQGYLFSCPRPASEVPLQIERLQHLGRTRSVVTT